MGLTEKQQKLPEGLKKAILAKQEKDKKNKDKKPKEKVTAKPKASPKPMPKKY
jgi:hypothetical protein